MKILAMSDMHGQLPKITEESDVICCCGDIVPLEYQSDYIMSVSWFCMDFVPWVDSLPCKKFIFIAGNHDFFLEYAHKRVVDPETNLVIWRSASDVMRKLLSGNNKSKHPKLVYLFDNSYEYEGVRFYGTPWIPELKRWAFYRSSEELTEAFSKIPKRFDVLLSHSGGKGVNYTANSLEIPGQPDYGSIELTEAMEKRTVKYWLNGHIHSGCHELKEWNNGCKTACVSLINEQYKRAYEPLVFEI